MAIGDLYQLTLKYDIPNQGDDSLNVFQYVQTAGTSTLAQMRDGWDNTIGLAIRTIQAQTVFWIGQKIENLFDLDEFLEYSYPEGTVHGVVTFDCSPSADAVGFTLKRSTRTVRNGAKRFGGLPAPYVVDNVIEDAGYLDDLNSLGELLSTEFSADGGTAVYEPVIVKRIKTANPDYPDNSKYPFIYSMPTSPVGAVMPVVAGYSFNTFPTTQVSRKANR